MENTVVQKITENYKLMDYIHFGAWLEENIQPLIEQEKQQIIDAFCEGRDNSVDYFAPSDSKLEEENYYKQKFEQD